MPKEAYDFQKYFVAHELWDVKDSFSTYVCTKGIYSCGVNCMDGFFSAFKIEKHWSNCWGYYSKFCFEIGYFERLFEKMF